MAFKNLIKFILVFSLMPVNYLSAQNTNEELMMKIEHSNWLDTASDATRISAIKTLLIEDIGCDTSEWKNIAPPGTNMITEDMIYRQGTYEVNYSRSNLQKKMWIVECIIAKKLLKETFITDNQSKTPILDYSRSKVGSKKEREAQKVIKKIYQTYRKYFNDKSLDIRAIKSPLLNSRYTWINPYGN